MPNLEELINIQRLYQNSQNKLRDITKKELTQWLNEGLDQNLIDTVDVFSKIRPYLKSEKTAYVVLLFIDIVSFSKKTNISNPKKLKKYLDEYYKKTIPLIHSYGGVVDKIIGDGIICLFGEPFLEGNLKDLLNKAQDCSHEILKSVSLLIMSLK
jgi:class 3 adenylate cyclase